MSAMLLSVLRRLAVGASPREKAPSKRPSGRKCLPALLIVGALATIASSAMPGAMGQSAVGNGYATLVDVREYAGTGYGGESAHVVRLDFQVTPGGTGSTTGSTASTTGGTEGGDEGPDPSPQGTARRVWKRYRLKKRAWIMRRGQRPSSGEGVVSRMTTADLENDPPVITPIDPIDPGGPNTTASTTGGTSSGTSGSTTGGGGVGSVTYYFGVESPYISALTTNGQQPAVAYFSTANSGGNTIKAYSVPSGGAHFEYRLPGAATRNVYFITHTNHPPTDENSTGYIEVSIWSSTLALTRRNTPSVAVDSRRVYGQPNLDGELPGDPNAELRNPSFAGWSYKGGLFVGNAPFSANDGSGTARVQAYVPAGTFTYPLASSYTLLALGRPSKFPSAVDYVGYVPSASDPNLATSTGSVTWANRWDLDAATPIPPGSSGTSGIPAGEYARFFVVGNASRIGVALASETAAVNGGYGLWQYFSSPAYEAQFPGSFPLNDSQPRTWTVDRTGSGGVSFIY